MKGHEGFCSIFTQNPNNLVIVRLNGIGRNVSLARAEGKGFDGLTPFEKETQVDGTAARPVSEGFGGTEWLW